MNLPAVISDGINTTLSSACRSTWYVSLSIFLTYTCPNLFTTLTNCLLPVCMRIYIEAPLCFGIGNAVVFAISSWAMLRTLRSWVSVRISHPVWLTSASVLHITQAKWLYRSSGMVLAGDSHVISTNLFCNLPPFSFLSSFLSRALL